MKVSELVELLKDVDPNCDVKIYDARELAVLTAISADYYPELLEFEINAE